jgi:hypothetical protein
MQWDIMTSLEIDTEKTLEIAASPVKLLLMAFGGLIFVIAGYFMTQATVDTTRASAEVVRVIGYVSIAFFGPVTALIVWRLLTQRGTVITLSPAGLRDVRVSPDIVPWPTIANISTWQHSGQSVMIVALLPGEEAKLRLTLIARLSRRANAKLGADGLAVAAQGTKIGHDALMAATIRYAKAHASGKG